ncbi:hypothetical protein TCON_0199 [Astathelohania contejeani]|uniref:Uncharacterized protein n=1 Tax=Astathelohania contejeani TaxID=164912 RepID=A0ABQ7I2I1_9MICR|nr:hypothetical protein TCON_0199 [Thelohania contejeani]
MQLRTFLMSSLLLKLICAEDIANIDGYISLTSCGYTDKETNAKMIEQYKKEVEDLDKTLKDTTDEAKKKDLNEKKEVASMRLEAYEFVKNDDKANAYFFIKIIKDDGVKCENPVLELMKKDGNKAVPITLSKPPAFNNFAKGEKMFFFIIGFEFEKEKEYYFQLNATKKDNNSIREKEVFLVTNTFKIDKEGKVERIKGDDEGGFFSDYGMYLLIAAVIIAGCIAGFVIYKAATKK